MLFVLPIGGADMPVVISLLNAFTGVAASATGFVLHQNVLIVSGMLVGASGTLLTLMMARSMGRSVANVFFGAFGQLQGRRGRCAADGGTVRPTTPEDVAVMLAYADRVIIVPGYGLAVAQAQHAVRELADELEKRGVDVKYAIHPVAGRMPGHMNVLLAEANVPYDQLVEMDEINPEFERTDVALVIGANDVTNPDAARPVEPDLRDADPRCRQGAERDRAQAQHAARLRRRGQPALQASQHADAVRRRARVGRQARGGRQGPLIPLFTARHVQEAVSPERAVEAVREAFLAYARGEWTMPPKVYVPAYPAGDFRAMPALGGGHALLKWVTSFPGNPARGLPTVTGVVLLSDASDGRLVAVLDAAAVTALRTGAAAVLAAETLGRRSGPRR